MGSGAQEEISSSSARERSSELQLSVGISGSYSFSEGSTQNDIETSIGEKFYFHQLDDMQYEVKAYVNMVASDPSKYLKDDIKTRIRGLSPKLIRRYYGDFYSIGVKLGARVRRTVDVKTNSRSSASQVKSSSQAALNAVAWRVDSSVDVDNQWADLSSDSETKATMEVGGGNDTSMWFNYDNTKDTSWSECKSEWRNALAAAPKQSFVPVVFSLRPLWELVGYFDLDKSQEMGDYYKNTVWKDDEAKVKEREKEMDRKRDQKRTPQFGVWKHVSGLCVDVRGSSNTPKDNANVELNTLG